MAQQLQVNHAMGMDRVLKKKKLPLRWIVSIGVIAALSAAFVYQMLVVDKKPIQTARRGEIQVSRVIKGEFQEFFLTNCYVAPGKTIFIDAQENGIVRRVYAEQGNVVKKGQLLLALENDELESELSLKKGALNNAVMDEENNGIRLQQMTVRARQQLLEMDHQIDVLGDECEQQEIEFKAGIISARGLQKTKRELAMWTEKKETLQKSTDLDLALLAREDEKARNSIQMLKTDLQRVKNRIGTLTVVSPAYGQITEYNASVGETKNIGSRIAQLDSMDTLKLKANMDEYYLPRITAGNKGSFTYETSEGQKASCIVTISWISPDVKNNSFEVEFRFDSAPPNVRFGQRFAVRVELGKKQDAVLLEQGQFYQTTGGSWVYVVDPSGRTATRRNIVIGRSNPDYLEVLKGLSPDERVVVSEYSGFNGVDRINLK